MASTRLNWASSPFVTSLTSPTFEPSALVMLSRVATLNIAMQYTGNVAEVSLQVLCASGESVEKGIVCTRVLESSWLVLCLGFSVRCL